MAIFAATHAVAATEFLKERHYTVIRHDRTPRGLKSCIIGEFNDILRDLVQESWI